MASFKAERAEAITEIGGTNVADHVAVDGIDDEVLDQRGHIP
ncbi:hypothetical protein [Hoyosella subflava]|uniref:Uncharacterized protein n=1 Tax=Hoyosella subflava (strain DSM 45089 / JCM 17490 / NBRC 109087 / DQS3-9A1) TaxID=443218 RepID=F6ELQ5_HOYSD|nr:hypothetical protein [Hoyosella subflava]AEF41503.1 hypothetical protein AS9A_3058 [Hoyosella subflava DQS3-9A1]